MRWPGRKVLPIERSRLNLNDPKGPIYKTHGSPYTHTEQGKQRERGPQERGHSRAPSPLFAGPQAGRWGASPEGTRTGAAGFSTETQLCRSWACYPRHPHQPQETK